MTQSNPISLSFLAHQLLDWYDLHGRELPWRLKGGVLPDPYKVWLSEIMLQQTTVATVKGYFERFLERWPTLQALAAAEEEEVLHAWQGLGYYSRARNLHRCARFVQSHYQGKFPPTALELQKLPGIGPYTSAAIAAIGFHQGETVVDGNVMRVISRLFGIQDPLPKSIPLIREKAQLLTPSERAGDYAQALMDLGATLCTPQNPSCSQCPWQSSCVAFHEGRPQVYPFRLPKSEKPTRFGIGWWILNEKKEFALEKRPSKGLLAHMMAVPTTPWEEGAPVWEQEREPLPPFPGTWTLLSGEIKHTFTHFHLRLRVVALQSPLPTDDSLPYTWCSPDTMGDYPLPTLMKKVISHALSHRSLS